VPGFVFRGAKLQYKDDELMEAIAAAAIEARTDLGRYLEGHED